MEFAQISVATASRALNEYTRRWPYNLTYERSGKIYIAEPGFVPAFSHDPLAGLDLVSTGLFKRYISSPISPVNLTSGISPKLEFDHVRTLTSAACCGFVVTVQYVSLRSGTRNRQLAPTHFFNSLSNWYCRAFDCSSGEFRVFRLSRFKKILDITALPSSLPEDRDWQTEVVLSLMPHPKHLQPEAIRLDLGLEDKPVLNVVVRAALAGYCLQEIRVDCSPHATLPAIEFPLHLANRYELASVASMQLSPGFAVSN
ncbi:WYL domain-containing protein [Vibrio neptunius]|uniref:WYL domain-containing protein n=1 Tax=Vibrio neptunius TaxID=170651 RepID=A0ABS3A6M4_9VIBR|nr:WYL domain-containing protein [Vibrio neptunius]MBN3493783.1 WYL domain-containing protein [Vibrio neptunius]MBN3516279.1 WYL domain-containing protein [Vibrio neptunius]MBN3550224.1 WYL domain-containing protein [Vibrio neptunius]MBN3578512.1 WYL domain-containing protein [Vibrio neptunius]MCH9872177.1 WYL domain-containing protein [Vibrio neptunius]